LLAALVVAAAGRADAQTILKIATLAPEGSSWMKINHSWATAVEKRTEGRVKVKFYAGGVQGDERDVLRKMKLGQLSGASVTGIGLSAIHPEARVVELARTYDELDALRTTSSSRARTTSSMRCARPSRTASRRRSRRRATSSARGPTSARCTSSPTVRSRASRISSR
jgi:TRAP-type C4-dicarboxylate transport system substrate-binding protein